MLITPTEAWMISSLVESVKSVPGDLAEVGTYQGASAAVIAETDPSKPLHGFDTFEGIPEPQSIDGSGQWAYKGNLSAVYDDAVAYTSRWPSIKLHKGLFPDSARGLESFRFSFVHLDMDLHDGTLSAMRWFYPRMSRGAILITHDFNFCPGVNKAFNEFLSDKPDLRIELPTNQAFFVKAE